MGDDSGRVASPSVTTPPDEPASAALPSSESADRPLPLAGTTVVDLGQIYLGPYASFLMAMSGARVIKVEPPQGEPLRGQGQSLPFALLNACKESVTLNLKSEQGRQLLLAMARQADVVMCNFAPGVPERLRISAEHLWEVNPRLVYAQATGFGTDGPDVGRTAMDITVQAHMGVTSVTGYPDRPPVKAGVAFADIVGGTHLYAAVATALAEVARTGQGRKVETSMAEAVFFTLCSNLQQWVTSDSGATPRTANKHAALGVSPYDCYECADGTVAVIVVNDRQWAAVLGVIGREDLAGDPRFRRNADRVEHMAEVDELITTFTASRSKGEVAAAFGAAGVPAAEVREVNEVVNDEHLAARGFISWRDDPALGRVPQAQSPIRWHGSEQRQLEPARGKGADNERVYGEFAGLSAEQVADLAQEGVV